MTFTPKELEGNVNVSPRSQLREFFVLLGGALALIMGIYIVLGLAVDLIVPHLPSTWDPGLSPFFTESFECVTAPHKTKQIQRLVDDLAQGMPEKEAEYTVSLAQSPQVNAFALPGGNIILFSTLLEEVESENELAFVLAHELGHFNNRDHLRALGRGLVLLAISVTILGEDNSLSQFIMSSLAGVNIKFSQRQERDADLFAADLLNKKYGHVGGACDFLERIKDKNKIGAFSHYLKSHPHPQDRLNALQEHIRQENYTPGKTTSLDATIKDAPKFRNAKGSILNPSDAEN